MLASLVIVFREAIEAGLIVGIVLAATRGVRQRGWWVSGGLVAGTLGACVVAAFAGELGTLFNGSGQELFNASVLLLAVCMLTWHNAWMANHGRGLAREVHAVSAAVAEGHRPLTALGVVVGVAVLREGSEVVLFLYGVLASGGASIGSMLAGGALGIAFGVALSALIYLGLLAVPAHRLFAVTTGLITLLAAGLAAQAVFFLQQADYFQGPRHAALGHIVAAERRQCSGSTAAYAYRLHGDTRWRAATRLCRGHRHDAGDDAPGPRQNLRVAPAGALVSLTAIAVLYGGQGRRTCRKRAPRSCGRPERQ